MSKPIDLGAADEEQGAHWLADTKVVSKEERERIREWMRNKRANRVVINTNGARKVGDEAIETPTVIINTDEFERIDFDPDQARDEGGKWTDGGGSGSGLGAGTTAPRASESRASEYKAPSPKNVAPHKNPAAYRPKDVADAVRALTAGEKIEFEQPREVSTLLDALADLANDAKAKGEKAPTYNLCNVSVAGTNLFCSESKGVSRIKMPQLSGKPAPGSKADALPRDPRGEANVAFQFREHLAAKGIRIDDTQERADYLRASQNELNGVGVAGLMDAMEGGTFNPAVAAIFISRDNYVIDGHHRWAAAVAVDLRDNESGDILMPVARIDMNIIEVLAEANTFATDWGFGPVSGATVSL